jgi:hypothetical protein
VAYAALKSLPEEICNLTELTELSLKSNPDLIFSQKQLDWLDALEEQGCKIDVDIER